MACIGNDATTSGGSAVTSATAPGMFKFPRLARFFRVRCSTYTSGAIHVIGWMADAASVMQGHGPNQVVISAGVAQGGIASNTVALYPLGIRSKSTNNSLTADRHTQPMATLGGYLVVQPYGIPEVSWQFACAAGGIAGEAAVTMAAAGAAGIRNYCSGFTLADLRWRIQVRLEPKLLCAMARPALSFGAVSYRPDRFRTWCC